MDDLSAIIHSLDAKEQSEFERFIQRNRRKEQRKDLDLFKALAAGKGGEKDLFAQLGIPNANAYHAVRRRLYQHLSDFILLRSVQGEEGVLSQVNGMVSVARHLSEAGSEKVATKILKRAEGLAVKNELFEALNTIYLTQANMPKLRGALSMDELLGRYLENQQKLVLSERIAIAKGSLKEKVQQFKTGGQEMDLRAILQESLGAFELQDEMMGSPKLTYSLLETIRESVIASKEFHSFEPIVESAYTSLKDMSDHHNIARILYMLAHAKYRNKRFEASMENLAALDRELEQCGKLFSRQMRHKMLQLQAGNHLFLNGLEQSIAIAETLVQDPFFEERGRNNARLNLVVYYFFQQEPEKARKTMSALQRSDKWYKENMGIEWLLKRDLTELLLFHELNETDLVSYRIRSINRRYKDLFQQNIYKRVETFIGLVKEYVENEMLIDLKALEEKTELSWEWLPKEEEDLQAMMFFAWFRSKLNKRGMYENVLELMIG